MLTTCSAHKWRRQDAIFEALEIIMNLTTSPLLASTNEVTHFNEWDVVAEN